MEMSPVATQNKIQGRVAILKISLYESHIIDPVEESPELY